MTSEALVLCIGLNPALDTTYTLPTFVVADVHRVHDVATRAGGKATNVARVVRLLGGRSLLVTPLGGATGEAFAADLHGPDDPSVRVIHTPEETRRSVAVVTPESATVLNEAGRPMGRATWDAVREAVEDVLRDDTDPPPVVAISGSLPPGSPPDAVGVLVRMAADHGAVTIVDTDASHLAEALLAGPDVVKPNRDELLAATGLTGPAGVAALRAGHPGTTVVASDGPAGLLCIGPAGAWRARPPEIVGGNPTGAGDALVAALAVGLARGVSLDECLADAVGAAAATVLDPVAGSLDPVEAARLAAGTTVIPLDPEESDPCP